MLTLRFVSHLKRIVDLNAEMPDCTFQLRMAEQELYRPTILRAAVNQRCFRSAHRMRAVGRVIKPDRFYPTMHDPRVLTS
jgi:hypothetical protein